MEIHEDINMIYEYAHTPNGLNNMSNFHNCQNSSNILTCTSEEQSKILVNKIKSRIKCKDVVEIGAGVGFVAVEMAKHANKVIAIESDPSWSWVFTKYLYKIKPNNLTWIFGSSDQVLDMMHCSDFNIGDISVVFTRSDAHNMKNIGKLFSNEVIMYYQEYDS